MGDALLACAVYVNPNPLISARLRVQAFLTSSFLPGVVTHFKETPSATSHKEHDALVRLLTGNKLAADDAHMKEMHEKRRMTQRGLLQHRSTKHAIAAPAALGMAAALL